MASPEGHEALMRRALAQLADEGVRLPPDVQPIWLTLGNVQTDLPSIDETQRVPIWHVARLVLEGMVCTPDHHPRHAMRCRRQSVGDAYGLMRERLIWQFERGCDATLSWHERSLAFGGGLHTLQDSYCIAHAARIDNGEPTSPMVDMYTYPSRQHPFTTKRDSVWQDADQTAFRPDAAAAITATVAALKIFVRQDTTQIEPFLTRYVLLRADIAQQLHPEHAVL